MSLVTAPVNVWTDPLANTVKDGSSCKRFIVKFSDLSYQLINLSSKPIVIVCICAEKLIYFF